ncbi:MarR family transcriptional regulator [bacterium]|nr:MarR family transcriptional regulator [bacterium]
MTDHRIGYLIKGVQQAIRRTMDEELRPLELSTSQYSTLSMLENSPQLSNAELARACFVTPQTMLQLIKTLERQGWLERRPHPDHGRIIQTHLTDSGRALLSQAHGLVNQMEAKMLTDLSDAQQQQLALALRRCEQNLR